MQLMGKARKSLESICCYVHNLLALSKANRNGKIKPQLKLQALIYLLIDIEYCKIAGLSEILTQNRMHSIAFCDLFKRIIRLAIISVSL